MDWKKILRNIVGFGGASFGAIYTATGSVKAASIGTGVAIATNIGGLIQDPPQPQIPANK